MASIQKRTSPLKFDYLAGKSENGSISNLSTKVQGRAGPGHGREGHREGPAVAGLHRRKRHARGRADNDEGLDARVRQDLRFF